MELERQNRNRRETAGQDGNVQDVEEVSPNKKRKQEPAGQTKRRRGNAQVHTVPSSQATLPGNLAPDLNHDPDHGLDHNPDLDPDLDPDLEPNPGPCPDPIFTMHSLGANWDHAPGQIFPTPPSSSLGVDTPPDPHLSHAYSQAAFTQFVEALPVNSRIQRAPIFRCLETIPFPQSQYPLPEESSNFSIYKPTMPVCAGSSACNLVEELPELDSMSSNQDYSFVS